MVRIDSSTLKIHCWGGLGSQLQALSYFLVIQKKYPRRKLLLVLHSSGISERRSEIDLVSNQIDILIVNDFTLGHNEIGKNKKYNKLFAKTLKNFVRKILDVSRIVITSENRIMGIKPWTMSIRSSYSNINLNLDTIERLGYLFQFVPSRSKNEFIGVHFRQGDLSALKPKSLINPVTIVKQIEKLNFGEIRTNKVIIYSDSEVNLEDFSSRINLACELITVDTLTTIFELTSSKVFIGTNSKVSLWVAIFKYGFKIPGLILLPTSMYDSFNKIVNHSSQLNDFIIQPYSY